MAFSPGDEDQMETRSKSVKTFATRHPFFFALLFFAISFCLDIGIIVEGHYVVPQVYVGLVDVVIQSLLALGVLGWLGWLRLAGFNGISRWRSLYVLWLPALLGLFYLASAYVTPVSGATTVVLAAVSALLTGLEEEARFRGVILQALLPIGPLGGAVLSSLLFGLAHMNNFITHLPAPLVLAQVIGAFLLGFGFAACRLRTRTIWPLIIFHALYDLPANITLFSTRSIAAIHSMLSTLSPVTAAAALIVPGFVLACYGLFLLRPGFLPRQEQKQLETS